MIELLAPAGDLERLKVALLYGADAVYVGGTDYSLRANAKNFSFDDLKIGVDFAHSLNKRVYVTVNIVPHNADTLGLEEYLLNLDKIGVDGIIVSDIYIMSLHQKLGLKMELHVSTQASTSNYESALFYKNLGAKRVVLARETSKEDIKRIKDETHLDLECFIHGAMCTSVSGRCVMSNYATNRDSNRGGCSQVCRYVFRADDNEPDFTMMPKDLNMVPFIKEMIEVGVNSFKVEGRMRSIYYIATVISMYRRIIDKRLKLNVFYCLFSVCSVVPSIKDFNCGTLSVITRDVIHLFGFVIFVNYAHRVFFAAMFANSVGKFMLGCSVFDCYAVAAVIPLQTFTRVAFIVNFTRP